VLQEGELERVGSSQTMRVDVRIIAATNRDLETAVEMGDFREDLFYRLNVMPIFMPPLRERSKTFPDRAVSGGKDRQRAEAQAEPSPTCAIRLLMRHHWPGNVRELENCLERSAIMSANGVIAQDVIELSGLSPRVAPARLRSPLRPGSSWRRPGLAGAGHCRARPVGSQAKLGNRQIWTIPTSRCGDERERFRVIAALEQAGWVQAKAARLLVTSALGMTPAPDRLSDAGQMAS
jgi:Nif-specific regulatory protein